MEMHALRHMGNEGLRFAANAMTPMKFFDSCTGWIFEKPGMPGNRNDV
jgi:hypothetical protein